MVHEDFMTELFQPVVHAAAVREAESPDAEARAALRVARQQVKRAHPLLNDRQVEFILDAAVRQIAVGTTDDPFEDVVAREATAYRDTVPFNAVAAFDALLSGRR